MGRIFRTIAAGAVGFVLSGIALTLLDMYLSGSGRQSPLQRGFIERAFVQLSVGDTIALVVAVSAAVFVAIRGR